MMLIAQPIGDRYALFGLCKGGCSTDDARKSHDKCLSFHTCWVLMVAQFYLGNRLFNIRYAYAMSRVLEVFFSFFALGANDCFAHAIQV